MAKLVGAGALFLIALLMFVGFLGSDAPLGAPTTLLALLLTVGLPAAAGAALVRGHLGQGRHASERREQLRQQTIESEVLRLAGERGGKLTLVEVVSEMAVPSESAKAALDALVLRQLADLEVTDSGVLVYAFHDVQHLPDKARARGILDA